MSSYDIDVGGIRSVLEAVRPEAESVSEKGQQALSDGDAISGQCGTASSVASAFSGVWSSRSRVGVRAGDYAQACADAVGYASAGISDEDELMGQTAGAAAAQVYASGAQNPVGV